MAKCTEWWKSNTKSKYYHFRSLSLSSADTDIRKLKLQLGACFIFNPPIIKHSPSSDPISGALWLFATFLLILGISIATQNFWGQFQYQLVCSLASLNMDSENLSVKIFRSFTNRCSPVWWFYLVQQILTEACYGTDLEDTWLVNVHPRPERC